MKNKIKLLRKISHATKKDKHSYLLERSLLYKISVILQHALKFKTQLQRYTKMNLTVDMGIGGGCRHLLVQSQQMKHNSNIRKIFKVNNKDNRTKLKISVKFLNYWVWTYFTNCTDIDFEQVKDHRVCKSINYSFSVEQISPILHSFNASILTHWNKNLPNV